MVMLPLVQVRSSKAQWRALALGALSSFLGLCAVNQLTYEWIEGGEDDSSSPFTEHYYSRPGLSLGGLVLSRPAQDVILLAACLLAQVNGWL
jgi:hypothetical protein